ncbi:hypothetical protein GCM10027051_34590 [Niabella terrae]
MRNWIGVLFTALTVTAAGCLKTETEEPCTPNTVEEEMPAMEQFAADSSITTTQDATGILYEIIEPGDGAIPSATSKITIHYTGRLLNGQGFDSTTTTPRTFQLNQLIAGWQIAIPKIKAGGKIKMIIPSSLAYGCDPYYGVVADRPLYFYVELLDVE